MNPTDGDVSAQLEAQRRRRLQLQQEMEQEAAKQAELRRQEEQEQREREALARRLAEEEEERRQSAAHAAALEAVQAAAEAEQQRLRAQLMQLEADAARVKTAHEQQLLAFQAEMERLRRDEAAKAAKAEAERQAQAARPEAERLQREQAAQVQRVQLVGGGWRFVQGHDDVGHDFRRPTWPAQQDQLGHIRAIAATAAKDYPTAMAFNTIGCIKSAAPNPTRQPARDGNGNVGWTKRPDWQPAGLFLRDDTVPRGWLYFPGRDSNGNDIAQGSQRSLGEIAQQAAVAGAAAFNTDGWIKARLVANHEIAKSSISAATIGGKNGLFVRV